MNYLTNARFSSRFGFFFFAGAEGSGCIVCTVGLVHQIPRPFLPKPPPNKSEERERLSRSLGDISFT